MTKISILLADQAFDSIRELLRDNVIKAGQLVSMSFLSNLIGLPLAPVREAVQKASALGLMKSIPKRGVLIIDSNDEQLVECLVIRQIWDKEGARILTRSLDEKFVTDLIKKHEVVIQKTLSSKITLSLQKEATSLDWEMHELLSSSIKNSEINRLYAINRDKITIMYNAKPIHPVRLVPAFNEHIAILTAVLAGDQNRVMDLLDYHYQQIFNWLEI